MTLLRIFASSFLCTSAEINISTWDNLPQHPIKILYILIAVFSIVQSVDITFEFQLSIKICLKLYQWPTR